MYIIKDNITRDIILLLYDSPKYLSEVVSTISKKYEIPPSIIQNRINNLITRGIIFRGNKNGRVYLRLNKDMVVIKKDYTLLLYVYLGIISGIVLSIIASIIISRYILLGSILTAITCLIGCFIHTFRKEHIIVKIKS